MKKDYEKAMEVLSGISGLLDAFFKEDTAEEDTEKAGCGDATEDIGYTCAVCGVSWVDDEDTCPCCGAPVGEDTDEWYKCHKCHTHHHHRRNRWHDVEEKLPKEDGLYLLWVGDQYMLGRYNSVGAYRFTTQNHNKPIHGVTHWRYLAAPPKSEIIGF